MGLYNDIQAGRRFASTDNPYVVKPTKEFKGLAFYHTPSSGFGELTPREAKAYFDNYADIDLASGKRYLIEITDLNPDADSIDGKGYGNIFNLMVTNVSFSPNTVPPEKKNVGMAVLDGLNTTEQIDFSCQAQDDREGTLKKWFDSKIARVAHSDGTAGLPVDYLLKIRILHSYINDEIVERLKENPYNTKTLVRPVSNEITIGRETSLQEISLNFTQFDTYMSV